MPRLKIAELEAKVRKAYPTFSHVEFNGLHYIGRWGIKTMNDANQVGSGLTYREALEETCNEIKREKAQGRAS